MSSNENPSAKDKYQWIDSTKRYPGSPPYVIGLPKGEGFSPWKIIAFDFTAIKTLVSLLIAEIIHFFSFLGKKIAEGSLKFLGTADLGLLTLFQPLSNWEKREDFHSFFMPWTILPKPKVADTWDQDMEFGRQRLIGLNPVLIRKCKQEDLVPESRFPVTDDHLKPFLGDDFSLESAFAENRLYLLDYKLFKNIITSSQEDQLGRYSADPLCLLYVNDQQKLLPVAIQLHLKEDSPQPIFTPSSSPEDWLAAKITVAATDIAYQGVVAHLIETHLTVEIFAVSLYRVVSPDHIIYQLLKPHFFNTLAINYMARQVFLGRGGFFDGTGALGYTGSNELLSRGYYGKGLVTDYEGEPWEFYKKALPYRLEERDVSELPGYYYRDDGLLIWNAIKAYVSKILTIHYKDAATIKNDAQLQAWKNELISENGGNIKGLLPPEKSEQLAVNLNNLDDLIEIVTNIIFTATAQHAAVNFGQYDYGAWIPNMPFALYEPVESLLEGEGKRPFNLLEWLPNRSQTIKQIVLMRTLTLTPPYSSQSLLTLTNPFKTEAEKQVFKEFHKDLKDIEKQIKERNKKLRQSGDIPYIYLLPSRIPQSTAI